jgi:hypothetical protein
VADVAMRRDAAAVQRALAAMLGREAVLSL